MPHFTILLAVLGGFPGSLAEFESVTGIDWRSLLLGDRRRDNRIMGREQVGPGTTRLLAFSGLDEIPSELVGYR